VSAQSGIEMIASRMMEWAESATLCRLVIVNKIDAENVDLPSFSRRSRRRSARVPAINPPRRRQARRRLLLQPEGDPTSRRSSRRTARSSTRSSKSTRS
jgi:hypothetical protein